MKRYIPHVFPLSLLTALAVMLIGAGSAAAQESVTADLYGVQIALPIPAGYCQMTDKIPGDRDLLALLRQVNSRRNVVLAMFADCEELNSFRAKGSALSRTGSYLAPFTAAHKTIKMSRVKFAGVIAKQLKKEDLASSAHEEAKKRVREADAKSALEENVNLGLIHQDDSGAFLGLLQNWSYEGGKKSRVAVVTGMTLVRRKVVSINLSAPHQGWSTVERLLVAQRMNINRLIAAN